MFTCLSKEQTSFYVCIVFSNVEFVKMIEERWQLEKNDKNNYTPLNAQHKKKERPLCLYYLWVI